MHKLVLNNIKQLFYLVSVLLWCWLIILSILILRFEVLTIVLYEAFLNKLINNNIITRQNEMIIIYQVHIYKIVKVTLTHITKSSISNI